ncbi:glycosyltransferase family A protein [Lacticaseibacillus nasuensis]|uniref:Glycosyltransferase 2-like domain-containing protein n=1 Tax=Lacticaseibacillus nasuensis JCM 17158 TaxID=1291734 RepID=A0A0R1JNF3_9LACO|nr:glycosyltransferase family A protein [Lacticaseibacillus nasuensis]KRK72651.1 hypothetical protein FD02_GL001624 [Lacticaseibacillus nasuensis JCM 17158]
MRHLISIILVANDAQEGDLSIPLSSINNQLGIDFRDLEVILIDNGQYRLRDPRAFAIFENINARYSQPKEELSWEDAFQLGMMQSDGEYLLFMGPDGLLNATSVLQTMLETVQKHPETEVVSGLVLEQERTRTRQVEYKVGRDRTSIRGRLVKREFLQKYQIGWHALGEYSDELFSRQVDEFAEHEVEVSEIAYARFTGRNVRAGVLGPSEKQLTTGWFKMMTAYLDQIKHVDEQRYLESCARVFVRFYSQLMRIDTDKRQTIVDAMRLLMAHNVAAWPYIKQFIAKTTAADRSPQAPWVSHPDLFNGFVGSFDTFLQQSRK